MRREKAIGCLLIVLPLVFQSALASKNQAAIVWKPRVDQLFRYSFHGATYTGPQTPSQIGEGLVVRRVVKVQPDEVTFEEIKSEGTAIFSSGEDGSTAVTPDVKQTLKFSGTGEPLDARPVGESIPPMVYPSNPIKVGDTWTSKKGPETQFKFEGTEPIDRFTTYKISYTSKESEKGHNGLHKGIDWIDTTDGSLVKQVDSYTYTSEKTTFSGQDSLIRLDGGSLEEHKISSSPKAQNVADLTLKGWAETTAGKRIRFGASISRTVESASADGASVALVTASIKQVVDGQEYSAPDKTEHFKFGPRGQFLSSSSDPAQATSTAEAVAKQFPVLPDHPVKYGDDWKFAYQKNSDTGVPDCSCTYVYEGDEVLGSFSTYRIKCHFTEIQGDKISVAGGVVWVNREDGMVVKLDLRETYPSVADPSVMVSQHSIWLQKGAVWEPYKMDHPGLGTR